MPSKPNYRGSGGGFRSGGYGGGGFGGGGGGMSLSFPPFNGMVRTLVLINVGVFFLKLLGGMFIGGFGGAIDGIFGFTPYLAIGHLFPWLWQFITYGFLHAGIGHILGNMLMLWMFGSQIEMDFGSRKFLEFYFFCMIGAAITTVLAAGVGMALAPASSSGFMGSVAHLWVSNTIGASGAVYGILLAFGVLHAEQTIMMFPIPISMKAKYFVIITILITFALSLGPQGPIAEFAHLGGLLFGFIYLRFVPRRGLGFAASEGSFGLRNRYQRWKRKRAQRKFEVYMRKVDRSEYFDEYGNFRDPNQKDKGNGEGKGGWVN
jgi:membrane associated rhomboid family serine protease